MIIVCVSLDWTTNNNGINNANSNNNQQTSVDSPLGAESSREDTYNYSPEEDYHAGYVAESHSGSSPDASHTLVDGSL